MKNMSKIILGILVIFCTIGVVFAETVIAPANTKFSVKIPHKFSELSIGDYKKMAVNPRTLKNKKIDWTSLGVKDNAKIFFLGTVSSVRSEESSSGSYISYYAQFNINKLIINGKSYAVNAQLQPVSSGDMFENTFTNNYDVVILDDLTDSDLQGDYVDVSTYYPQDGVYNFIYYSHNACFSKTYIGDYFICLHKNIKNWNQPIVVGNYEFKDKQIDTGEGGFQSLTEWLNAIYESFLSAYADILPNTPANIVHANYIKKTYNNMGSFCQAGYRDLDIMQGRKPRPLSAYGCIE